MAIKFENVCHDYAPNTPFSYAALKDINLEIRDGKMTAIIGATGSGKSTLVQHLNGLLRPTSGRVQILDHTIIANEKAKNLKALRSKVGLVFQFPEMQLFEETIYKDVSFGPKNFAFDEETLNNSVHSALNLVGIDQSLWERSPLDLSGGQKRRVAIAGVLATNPEIIVLDEPTAGLDPQGSKDMMDLFIKLNQEYQKTIIMVSHDMDHVLKYSDDVVVLKDGEIFYAGDTKAFFKEADLLEELGFVAPKILQLKRMLKKQGLDTKDELDIENIAKMVKEARK